MSDTIHYLEMLIGIVVMLTCVGAIPFAMKVTGHLAKIEGKLDAMAWQEEAIEGLRKDVTEIQIRMASRQ